MTYALAGVVCVLGVGAFAWWLRDLIVKGVPKPPLPRITEVLSVVGRVGEPIRLQAELAPGSQPSLWLEAPLDGVQDFLRLNVAFRVTVDGVVVAEHDQLLVGDDVAKHPFAEDILYVSWNRKVAEVWSFTTALASLPKPTARTTLDATVTVAEGEGTRVSGDLRLFLAEGQPVL